MLVNISAVNIDLGNFQEVYKTCDEALKILEQPHLRLRLEVAVYRANLYAKKGLALRHENKLAEAYKEYQAAADILQQPDLVGRTDLYFWRINLYINYGVCLELMKQFDASLQTYESALELVAKLDVRQSPWLMGLCAGLHLNLGNTLLAMGQTREAIVAYQRSEQFYEHPAIASWYYLNNERCRLYGNMARLISDLPPEWPQATSEQLAEMLELAPPRIEDHEPDRYDEMRQAAAFFHSRWLAYCLDRDELTTIPAILAAIQGRQLADQVLDELDETEDAQRPKAVKAFQETRQRLRALANQIDQVRALHRLTADAESSRSYRENLSVLKTILSDPVRKVALTEDENTPPKANA